MHQYNYNTIEISNSIYEFIVHFYSLHLYPPSYEEIREHIGFKSNTSLIHYLDVLVSLNYIHYQNNISRSISLNRYCIRASAIIDIYAYSLNSTDLIIYDYIVHFICTNMYSPSYEEIANNCSLQSKSSVQFHLRHLANVGLIQLDSYPASRCIHLNYYELKYLGE